MKFQEYTDRDFKQLKNFCKVYSIKIYKCQSVNVLKHPIYDIFYLFTFYGLLYLHVCGDMWGRCCSRCYTKKIIINVLLSYVNHIFDKTVKLLVLNRNT